VGLSSSSEARLQSSALADGPNEAVLAGSPGVPEGTGASAEHAEGTAASEQADDSVETDGLRTAAVIGTSLLRGPVARSPETLLTR
jgi:hypothetical protein